MVKPKVLNDDRLTRKSKKNMNLYYTETDKSSVPI